MEKGLESMVIPHNSLWDDLVGLGDRFLSRVKCQPNALHLAILSYNDLKNLSVFV